MRDQYFEQANNARRWAFITEVATKLIMPITTMLLARLIAPEAFGVVTTATMVVSFCDMFSDAGFQKYLVQHEFADTHEKSNAANVSFWTNLAISIFLWAVVFVFRNRVASLVGNPGLGNVIVIACAQLPMTSFSSIQEAMFRRDFDFKTLFGSKFISTIIPLVIAVPLALCGLSFWSIIIGNAASRLFTAIYLTLKSSWKPSLFYCLNTLRNIFSFSIWSLFEAIVVWLTIWIDVFLIGNMFTTYYLGLYKNSVGVVANLLGIIYTATAPVLFSMLSRIQSDVSEFQKGFLTVQKQTAYLIFPFGTGLLLFSSLATNIILGHQWAEATDIVGITSFTIAIRLVTVSLCGEVFRAKGKPIVSALLQLFDLICIVVICAATLPFGFWPFVYGRAFSRFALIIPELIMLYVIGQIRASDVLKNLSAPVLSTIVMSISGICLKMAFKSVVGQFVSIGICIVIYFATARLVSKPDFESLMSMFYKNRKEDCYDA